VRGRPWLAAEIDAALAGRAAPERPEGRALAALIAEHYEDVLARYGREVGARVARKHLGWWLEGRGVGDLLKGLMREEDPAAVLAALRGGVAARLEDAADARLAA
jgi:tRNA-dihydrouridine synthase B